MLETFLLCREEICLAIGACIYDCEWNSLAKNLHSKMPDICTFPVTSSKDEHQFFNVVHVEVDCNGQLDLPETINRNWRTSI